MDKKQILESLCKEGLVEKKESNPDGGFYGRQTGYEVTAAGRAAGVWIRRASGPEFWPGEIRPIACISRGEEILWAAD